MANDGIQTSVDLKQAILGAFTNQPPASQPPSTSPGLGPGTGRVGYDRITGADGTSYIVALDRQTGSASVYRGDAQGGYQKVEVEDHLFERIGTRPGQQLILMDGTQIYTGNDTHGPTIGGKPAELTTRGSAMNGAVPTGIVITPLIAEQMLNGADKIEPLYIKAAPKFDLAAAP